MSELLLHRAKGAEDEPDRNGEYTDHYHQGGIG